MNNGQKKFVYQTVKRYQHSTWKRIQIILYNIARYAGEENPNNESAELLEKCMRCGNIVVKPNMDNNTGFRVRSESIRYFSQL